MVPLKLVCNDHSVWINKKPSSTHFCRPVKLQYKKESKELSKEEEIRLREEVAGLQCYTFEFGDKQIMIKYKVEFTIFDGKVINALTNTLSTQSCNICGAKPKEINEIELIRQKEMNSSALTLGLSSLHAWINALNTYYILEHLFTVK